jgi:hypothetical protein
MEGWEFPVFECAVSTVGGLRVGVVLFGVAAWGWFGVVAWNRSSCSARFVLIAGPVNGPGHGPKHARGVCHAEVGGRAVHTRVGGVLLVWGGMLVELLGVLPGAGMRHSC